MQANSKSAQWTSGVAPIACVIEPLEHAASSLSAAGQDAPTPSEREPLQRDLRALLHWLGENDVRGIVLQPGVPLGEQLVAGSLGALAA